MRIHVKLFAILRERAGVSEMHLDLPENSTVAAATDALRERLPNLAEHLNRAAFAVNRNVAATSTILSDSDELAVLPPVSGG